MAQQITKDSPKATVDAFVRQFIGTTSSGEPSLNENDLVTWLAEQFSYLLPTSTASGTAMSHATAMAKAKEIAQALKVDLGLYRDPGTDYYPEASANGIKARDRLVQLRDDIEAESNRLESDYKTFYMSLVNTARSAFTSLTSSTFPAGVQLLEVTRGYLETFVTDRGEESRPSSPSTLVTMDQNDNADITLNAPPAGRNITKRRLYRSATTATNAVWRLQGEYPIAQTVINDAKLDDQLNDVLATMGWLEPPATLQGLTGMSNGIMVGYVGSTLHACEPYASYAWPAKYDKPLPHKIMGIASIGQSVLVATTGYPYLVSGSDSISLTEQRLPTLVPCASARSMVPIANSVFYASPDGLALYENGAVSVVTEGIIDRSDWAKYNPATMAGAGFDGRYFGFYTKADSTRGCLVFDYKSRTIAEMGQAADAVFANQDGLYALNGTQVLNLLPASGTRRTGTWSSKVFRLVKPAAFLWLHVDSDFANNGQPASATVRVYADGTLHDTIVVTSREPVRLPPGRSRDWKVEIESASTVNGVVLATTTAELKAVL
jgi:hypothetical protein